jgi:hypothetical protein
MTALLGTAFVPLMAEGGATFRVMGARDVSGSSEKIYEPMQAASHL